MARRTYPWQAQAQNADVYMHFRCSNFAVNVEAAAFILAPEKMQVPVVQQKDVANKFAEENLSAFNAAQNGLY